MEPNLNPEYLPTENPYASDPWMYTGGGEVTLIPNPNIVDWVLVEIRDAATAAQANASTTAGRQAAWLLNDGSIVGLNGTSNLQFNHSIIHQLYVVIWHRNHLAVLSGNPLTSNAGVYTYNFTSAASQVYGGSAAAKELAPGVWGMISGDGNADRTVDMVDKSAAWSGQSGTNGYKQGDFDLNGRTDNPDKNEKLLINLGHQSQVPE